MKTKTISQVDIDKLRESELLTDDETVIIEGDLLIAINPLTSEKRIIKTGGLVLECNRKILMD